MPEPLDLEPIAAREAAATPGPWEPYPQYGHDFYAYLGGEYLRGVGNLNFGDGDDAEADLAFVLAARQDVPALLDEIRRLRAELADERRMHSTAIDDRDHATIMADRLAAAIAPTDVIGEHSSMNDPWENALAFANERAAEGV